MSRGKLPRSQSGLSLIEAMIGLVLAGIISLGLSQLFIANLETYQLLVAQSRMQESARFALGHLGRGLERAGFKGCFSANAELYSTFLNDPPYEFNLNEGLIGYEGGAASWTPDITAVLPSTVGATDSNIYSAGTVGPGNGIDTSTIINGTDIMTVNFIARKKHRLAVNMPTSSEDIETETTDFSFDDDYIAYIHDCEKGSLFRITSINGDDDIEHTGVVDPDGYTNARTRLAEYNTFETDAFVSAIESHTFYIAPGESTNNSGAPPLSLWRKSGVDAPIELIDGVEDMQITYGVDIDNDGVPTRYVDADAVLDFSDVLTVRVSVVVTSLDDVSGTTSPTYGCVAGGGQQFCHPGTTVDGLLRRTFTRTVTLRNRP